MIEDVPFYQLGVIEGHVCYLYELKNGEVTARCSCGATWTYPSNSTIEHMRSIYQSHLKYFQRKPMETL